MTTNQDPLYSGTILEFVAAANEYCKYVERASEIKGDELLKILQRLLPYIYLKASLLPDLEPFFEEENRKSVKESDWIAIHDTLRTRFGSADSYLEVFDERIRESDTPVTASLAENMADIYQDLKDFLILYHTGTNELMNDALWECRLNFENYWGQKLVNSMRAIHQFLYSGEEIAEYDDAPDEAADRRGDHNDWFISRRQNEYRKGAK
ncbi:MAG: DUF5063 domain-containing protein [Bacteroidales bacterium]